MKVTYNGDKTEIVFEKEDSDEIKELFYHALHIILIIVRRLNGKT